ncbi:MAG: c-type cytochrome [Bacteroidetes bacterium]|nr:c-type cytochrome [Bacteroidota bacterium]
MKKVTLFVISLFAITLFMTSCGGGSQPAAEQPAATATGPYADLPADIQAMMPRGEEIYKTKCTVCHQTTGLGIDNVFPPLSKADYLLADKVRAVAQTLNGSKLDMVVNGKTYSQEMVPQVDTKEDAVAVINYVLNNFGNKDGFVTMAEVQGIEIKPRKK